MPQNGALHQNMDSDPSRHRKYFLRERETITSAEIESVYNEILGRTVVVATTSDYRKKVFGTYQGEDGKTQGIGFSKVDGVRTKDLDEALIQESYEKLNPHASVQDPFRTRMAEAVATGKVALLLESLIGVSGDLKEHMDKVLIGIDTLPTYFAVRDDNGILKYRGDAVPKPKESLSQENKNWHEVDPRTMIESELEYLVDMLRKEPKTVDEKWSGDLRRECGVQVTTGISICVPIEVDNTQKLVWKAYSLSSFLNFGRLEEIAALKSSQERKESLDALVDQILQISSKEENPFPTQISGGINFADEEIRNILKIRETALDFWGNNQNSEETPETGIYLGAPEKGIKQALREVASEIVLEKKRRST
ncbi:MAG: hypothetical protein COV59_04295 [Candidatus Magasanikbacteria bacterium CG11_big_fil_rev_8_21_14_0_20_39_34]|uniref:Uncharacterized protein n=1 Tax=Candidatus Magasanikbacteria bacterium CG11_big_fil_rev_8_21_14_0_20_39_34 TaxID=1974653 RepID=A0A2H0N4Q4_9BACT|nr:MAG: hypothetical protein COV59_04295 [Candidatus Magasanikbacteria bacterium CG11_big_fil_rev_8_21_14_0_20_39_34]